MRQRKRRASGQGRSEEGREAALAGFDKLCCSEVPVDEGEREAGGKHLLDNERC